MQDCNRRDVEARLYSPLLSFFDIIQMLAEQLVHGEHMDHILFENGVHPFIATNLPLVRWLLEFLLLDVSPYLFDDLRTGKLYPDQHRIVI